MTPATVSAPAHPVLTLSGLIKHFGGTTALDNASLTVRRGTVHALLGGNGSGKSTSIKILAGVYHADAGELTVADTTYSLDDFGPAAARAAGLRFVHQDLGLFDALSVAENFALDAGYPTTAGAHIDWRRLHDRVREILADYELDVDPRTPVHRLRPSDRTMVAIARALQDQESAGELILVLDEPTARLPQHESRLLLERIRRRADRGQTVILVSHRLREVLDVADDFTVFRDGRAVETLVDASPTEDELVELMAGRAAPALAGVDRETGDGQRILSVDGLEAGPLRGIDLTVDAGEIVGIAGLVGSGRSSLLRTIFGEHPPAGGTMTLRGKPHTPQSINAAVAAGIAFVPEDRGLEAAFPDLTVTDNLSVSVLRRFWRRRGMAVEDERRNAERLIGRFGVRVAGPGALFSSMSGGNQQKVILARWLQREPALILLDEPTQGVDVMSRADIYRVVRRAADRGAGVLVSSSDVSELCALCDRVVILRDGLVVESLPTAGLEPDQLMSSLLKTSGSTPKEAR